MPTNDDIGDLPSLMPDSDEIKSTPSNAKKRAPVASNSMDSRQPPRSISPPRTASDGTPQVVNKNSGLLWGLVVLMIVSVVGGGYWSYNKLTDVDLLLTVSRGELDHARKRIGELEALVVATDVNSNKSGTVVQTQVKLIDNRAKDRNKFIDTEIDKLWGVSYRTNKPAIEENNKAIDNNTATVKQHQGRFKSQQEQLDVALKSSAASTSALTDQLHKISVVQGTLDQLLAEVTAHEKALADQKKTSLLQVQKQAQNVRNLELALAQTQAQNVRNLESALAQQKQVLDAVALRLGNASAAQQQAVEAVELRLTSASEIEKERLESRINQLEGKLRVVGALEQNASQMDERVYMVEQSFDSVTAFRQDTNRKLDQLQGQIRNLSYSE